ncbi:MAG: DUF2380 domain-containing protein [Methylococcales bacterium]|nr:DUF2380 domain-containing protein [Methylococcales bacterium]
MNRPTLTVIILSILLLTSNIGQAAPHIAILNFELNDITSLPNTPQEKLRTASIQPLLERAISQTGDYEIIHINATAQATANSSFGYLFRFNDLAAKLGEQFGADWVIIGQHSKPSFLFSYLMVHLINVKNQALGASYDIELKGNHEKVTKRGVRSLANKIHESIKLARYSER